MKDSEVTVCRRTDADAQHDPAVAEAVQGRGGPRQLPRPSARHRRDNGADPDPSRLGGYHRQDQPRVHDRRTVASVGEDNVVPEKVAVEARLLGRNTQLDELARLGAEVGHRDAVLESGQGRVGASYDTFHDTLL